MFDIQTQLYEGWDVRFGLIDHEKDPEIESKWTHDSDFMRMVGIKPARAIHSHDKAGFRHEGRMRLALNKEGRRWDILTMGILREERMEQNDNKPAN